ncbi:MAG: PaaI family thioesterase [Acidimicrobiia bacterium]
MAITRLKNSRWGFETNCFVCEPRNAGGLQIPFFHDDDTDVVIAEFTLDDTFSGAPMYVHGGITLAVLDEAAAWATIAVAGKFAVTHRTTTTFDRPVRIGVPYRVEAMVVDRTEERITTRTVVRDAAGKVRARNEAEFVVLGAARAVDAIGDDVSGPAVDFLR